MNGSCCYYQSGPSDYWNWDHYIIISSYLRVHLRISGDVSHKKEPAPNGREGSGFRMRREVWSNHVPSGRGSADSLL